MMETVSLSHRGCITEDDHLCDDCIDRCDGENDCNDESDEQRCQTLYWEDGNKDAYSEDIPPGPSDDDFSKTLPGNYHLNSSKIVSSNFSSSISNHH